MLCTMCIDLTIPPADLIFILACFVIESVLLRKCDTKCFDLDKNMPNRNYCYR